jgi:transcriptional regulator with GAF, ATPase, and Fis domain
MRAYDTVVRPQWLTPRNSSVVNAQFYSKLVDRFKEFDFVKNFALCSYSPYQHDLLCAGWISSQNWRLADHAVPAPFELRTMPKDISITKQVLETRRIRTVEPGEDVSPSSPLLLLARAICRVEREYIVPLRTDNNKLFGSFAFDVPSDMILSPSICERLLMAGEYLALYLDNVFMTRSLRERTRDLNLINERFGLLRNIGDWISAEEGSFESVGKVVWDLREALKATVVSVWVADGSNRAFRCLVDNDGSYGNTVGRQLTLSDRELQVLQSLPKQGSLLEEVEDSRELSSRFLENLDAEEIKSTFVVPLVSSREIVGVLFAGSTHSGFFHNRATTGTLSLFSQNLTLGLAVSSASHAHLNRCTSVLATSTSRLPALHSSAASLESPTIIGRSAEIRRVLDRVSTVSNTTVPVLLLGETGTGKDLIAGVLHHNSPRRGGPLVTVNCAAIPAGLIESELFGHEKGAYTGAITRTAGYFEQAHEGTLFLDEIGDLPLELQTKLLRVLQDRTVQRIGGLKKIPFDVRIVAATHRDIRAMVSAGTFREDLYYRLNVLPINIPPLRERRDDIPLLVDYFATNFCKELGRPPLRAELRDIQRLTMNPWPGNIRELENVVKRAVVFSKDGVLNFDCIDDTTTTVANRDSPGEKTWNAIERETIVAAIRKAKRQIGGRSGAAELLGLKRTTLKSKMKRLGISLGDI